jgi:hypothetical protein
MRRCQAVFDEATASHYLSWRSVASLNWPFGSSSASCALVTCMCHIKGSHYWETYIRWGTNSYLSSGWLAKIRCQTDGVRREGSFFLTVCPVLFCAWAVGRLTPSCNIRKLWVPLQYPYMLCTSLNNNNNTTRCKIPARPPLPSTQRTLQPSLLRSLDNRRWWWMRCCCFSASRQQSPLLSVKQSSYHAALHHLNANKLVEATAVFSQEAAATHH